MRTANRSCREKMSRRSVNFLLFLFDIILLIDVECSAPNRPQIAQPPNIIVILADDLGWNDVSFHGSNQIVTPNIDALGYNGVILNRHYVLPTCTPSRTAFLTGRYPLRMGLQGMPLHTGEARGIWKNVTLLPQHLRKLGYSTHLVGKWHIGYYTAGHTPANRGFQTFFGYYNGYIQYFNHTISIDAGIPCHIGNDLHRDVPNKLSPEFASGYMTDLITEEAEKIIHNHEVSEPLYLQVAHLATHATGSNEEKLQVRNMSEVNERFGYIKDINRRLYAGVLSALDESVGRIVDALQRKGLLENSIVLFLTDNGAQTEGMLENFGWNYPLRGLKFSQFEGGVRGVACVYSPLITKQSRIFNELMHITDWLPTLYSAAHGDVNDLGDLDGVNQWDSIKDDTAGNRNSVLVDIDEVTKNEAAIIDRYKLVKRNDNIYDGYYGESGMNHSYPKYKAKDVLMSLAGRAICEVSKCTLTQHEIRELRQASRVHCSKRTISSDCSRTCLFDLQSDPCESIDISTNRPEIVKQLQNYLDKYRAVLVRQERIDQDPAAFPENFNGTWMPWLVDEL